MKLHISDSKRFMEKQSSVSFMQDYLQPIDSLGFMELLGMQSNDHHHFFHHVSTTTTTTTMVNHHIQDYSFNAPAATPNSSSISSESVAGVISNNNNQKETPLLLLDDDDGDEANQHPKTKKELKAKKISQKRQKEARFAFMTKSEIDHLEDGYRWRKYGQKAVKNSPFPRSYYRCTSASCSVKKRVERSFSDPAIVVTTYEGQHTHSSPTMPFSSFSYDQMILSSHQQLNNFSTMNSPAVARFSSEDKGLLEDIVQNWSFVKEGM